MVFVPLDRNQYQHNEHIT